MKRILITGSLGYLGSMLSQYLTDNNYSVVGYDTGFFKKAFLYKPKNENVILTDVRFIEEKDLENIDVLIHLAGISNDPVGKLKASLVYDPTRYYSFKIANMCKKMGVKFIFASSCSVYGLGNNSFTICGTKNSALFKFKNILSTFITK